MTNSTINEAIVYMHKRLDDCLSLSELAAQAAYSPYHFARLFKQQTGLSPLYYVSSLRLQKAKALLLNTDLSVREVGFEVGQQSLGTFTTRFTDRVGLAPTEFRRSVQLAHQDFNELKQLHYWHSKEDQTGITLQGHVQSTQPFEGVILIGLFAKPIPEGLPLYGTLIPKLGSFTLSGIQPGAYYLMATSIPWQMQANDFLLPHTTLRTRSKKPIQISHQGVPDQTITLYPPRLDDPPILISLPLLMKQFLHRVQLKKPQSVRNLYS